MVSQWALAVALALLAAAASTETRWSRQIYNTRVPVARERRQFNAGDWIPLTQPCLTCRPLTDPADASARFEDIGLTPPRPPVTRQIHNGNNFFQDESSILQAPPPPSFPSRHHVPQFQNFLQQFGDPNLVQFPGQQYFSQQQPSPFQNYLNNLNGPNFLLGNVPVLNSNPNLILSPSTTTSPQADPKEVKQQQTPPQPVHQPIQQLQQPIQQLQQPIQQIQQPIQQIQQPIHHLQQPIQHLHQPIQKPIQQKPVEQITRLELPLPNAPVPFLPQPQMLVLNPSDPYLTPPPIQNSSLHLPGLEKEEIQLLYVPVETLRQRGNLPQRVQQPQKPQQVQQVYQTLPQQNIQFQNPLQSFLRPLGQPNGHYITQAPASPQPPHTLPSTTPKQHTASVTVPTLLLHHSLPSADPPQQFVTLAPSPAISDLPPEEYPTFPPQSEPQRVVSIKPRPQTTTPEPVIQFLKPVSEQPSNDLTGFDADKVLPRQRPQFIQQTFSEPATEPPVLTTTLAPHQPPLSVYMGPSEGDVQVVDVLRALKDAKTIPVLDNFVKNSPRVFVGPANLNLPRGYNKFELPYLSNIENNRVERKVERLPFFVAPLNFNPPAGYSKIPFPAPHIGSVVVSSEAAMRAALLHDKGTTISAVDQEYLSHNLPSPSPELPGLINDLETEQPFLTTTAPETTTFRPRQRRPNNVYRPPGRRPVPHSRLRTTTQSEFDIDNTQFLKETVDNTAPVTTNTNPFPKRGSTKRFRPKTTTENYSENRETLADDKYFTVQTSPQPERASETTAEFGTVGETQPDIPASTPLASFDLTQDNLFPSTTSKEVQGIFEVNPQPVQVENNGNSGFYQQNPQQIPTEQPVSPTQFFEHTRDVSSSTQNSVFDEQSEPTRETEPELEVTENLDVPRRSKFAPSVPGVKSVPNPSVVKIKSHVRSRPRGRISFQTTQLTTPKEQLLSESQIDKDTRRREEPEPVDDNPANVETSPQEPESQPLVTEAEPPTTKASTKYGQFYRGQRKPARTTTPRTRSDTYTLRPHRRSTVRTSVSTKRIRKPTTPSSVETTSETYETNYGRKRPSFAPSGVSNEIYDERERPSPRPTQRKTYVFPKQKNVDILDTYDATTPTSTTQRYQSRKDENVQEPPRTEYPEWNPSESGVDISGIVLTTMPPTGEDAAEEAVTERKKHVETAKKALDPELEKKSARRRVRVRVHKRPHDNFETAESQNVGTVSNILVPPTPAKPNSEPDLYRFSKDSNFDFDATGKFIGTKNKQHVRNITTDILENTNVFSAPGVEDEKAVMELQKVTIAEAETVVATTEAAQEKPKTEEEQVLETTTDLAETTTEVLEETTEGVTEEPATTDPPVTKVKQSRIIKTSTSHQVSHETEICYRGKCIKTNSANPDKDLKLLVERTNAELRSRGTT